MRIIYLSRNMQNYGSAAYQKEVADELDRQAQVFFYGSGFKCYDRRDSIDDVIAKSPFRPDAIVMGHAWLNDKDGSEVDPHPQLQLFSTTIPKIIILNKEYVNLIDKMDYIRRHRFDLGFTHHHDIQRYTTASATRFTFWPFACDLARFKPSDNQKLIDLGFSGVLQNLNRRADQTDIRVRIMRRLFYTYSDVPLLRKAPYRSTKIFWNSIGRNKVGRSLSTVLRKRKYLSTVEYSNMIRSSKMFINTLSPMGLISPRFFECMASGTLVFCQKSDLYKNIFPNDIFVSFKEDLSDFDEKFFHYLEAQKERENIVEKAQSEARSKHGWDRRVSDLLKAIGELVGEKIVA